MINRINILVISVISGGWKVDIKTVPMPGFSVNSKKKKEKKKKLHTGLPQDLIKINYLLYATCHSWYNIETFFWYTRLVLPFPFCQYFTSLGEFSNTNNSKTHTHTCTITCQNPTLHKLLSGVLIFNSSRANSALKNFTGCLRKEQKKNKAIPHSVTLCRYQKTDPAGLNPKGLDLNWSTVGP